ncbi:SCP2 sterol-binding domain-containing protein [Brevibacillus migulae]|uniref:SCP2 sterol-binding domain-containing protein n=1 Tax=Brevibacillus migulae TaxID=1644114 RepID=UPI00106EAB18|nr:SCP2 sterol-binding domain-containing protein [Brevibacillus migulae]
MLSLSVLLQRFAEELRRKTYYAFLIKGWERKICIVAEDLDRRYSLRFHPDGVQIAFWPEEETPDLIVRGKEEDLLLLFAGEELTFLHVKDQIDTKGSVRDQLKLDALIRLAAVGAAAR